MNLSLKKVKYFDEMSEETPCFVAELYDNGVHMATVKNDGQGGGNMLYPVKGKTYADITKYDNLDVEADIFGMVYDYDTVTKNQNNGLLIKKDDKIMLVGFKYSVAKMKKTPQGVTALHNAREKYLSEGYQVLNRNL